MIFKTVDNHTGETEYFDSVRRISVERCLHKPACQCSACISLRKDKDDKDASTEILNITLLSGMDSETEVRFNAQCTGYLLNEQGKTVDMIRISAK